LNILVYRPNGTMKRIDLDWLYGFDIIKQLINRHPEWHFLIADGTKDNIWQDIDVLLRPNRHDGLSRMVLEAQALNIPVIWSYETGRYVEPNIEDIERRLIELEKKVC